MLFFCFFFVSRMDGPAVLSMAPLAASQKSAQPDPQPQPHAKPNQVQATLTYRYLYIFFHFRIKSKSLYAKSRDEPLNVIASCKNQILLLSLFEDVWHVHSQPIV